jgi:hypothetical protein
MSSPEQTIGPENTAETPKVSAEHYEQAERAIEKKETLLESAEKSAERAKIEALEAAVSVEKGGVEKDRQPRKQSPARRRGALSKAEKKASFDKHMTQVQSEMSAPKRAFSKVIHTPIIEKASEAIGSTVARPNAILAGSLTALFLVLGVYVLAKTQGYTLSGFETIGAFIVGWSIGMLYDFFKVMITGKKS